MDIRFCDICNESVPEPDLARGRAVQRGGRTVCASCEAAMGGRGAGPLGAGVAGPRELAFGMAGGGTVALAPATVDAPRAARAERGGGAGTAVGLVALTVAATGTWLALERFDVLERRHAADVSALSQELDAARRARAQGAAELSTRLAEVEAAARTAGTGAVAEAERTSAALMAELEAARVREVEVRRELEAARVRIEEVLTVARRDREEDGRRLAAAEVDLRATRDRLIAVEENLRMVGARGPTPGAPVAAAAPAPAAPAPPSWERHLADLRSDDEGLRVDAVLALGETRDRAVVPHVLPMLQDGNLWVRMVAAEALGMLGDPSAVPALIDALEDERAAVREHALFALQALTKETLRFDANASEAERSKRVREWREWWAANRDRLLA